MVAAHCPGLPGQGMHSNKEQDMTGAAGEVLSEVRGRMGMITLNRAKALNALSLGMVRDLLATLLAWQKDEQVLAVAIRGMGKEGVFGAFCAGGDIRFLHGAGSTGNPQLARAARAIRSWRTSSQRSTRSTT